MGFLLGSAMHDNISQFQEGTIAISTFCGKVWALMKPENFNENFDVLVVTVEKLMGIQRSWAAAPSPTIEVDDPEEAQRRKAVLHQLVYTLAFLRRFVLSQSKPRKYLEAVDANLINIAGLTDAYKSLEPLTYCKCKYTAD